MASDISDSAKDTEAVVLNTLREFLGLSGELPIESKLRQQLGMDSLLLVTIILELANRLALDIETPEFQLGDLDTVEDIVSLAVRLSAAKRVSGGETQSPEATKSEMSSD